MTSLLPIGTLATAATLSLCGLIPGIGAIIASAGATSILKSLKRKSSEAELKRDEEKAKKIIEGVQNKLLEDQKRVVSCFQLNTLEIDQFVERIEEGETVSEVW